MRNIVIILVGTSIGLAAACSDQTIQRAEPSNVDPGTLPDDDGGTSSGDDGGTPDDAKAPTDATADTYTLPALNCAATFGTGLTAGYGRLDGTVRAVVPPGKVPKPCRSDDNHVIVQLDVVEGAKTVTYPVWIDIESDLMQADTAVRYFEKSNALVGGAWASGWHTSPFLDYASIGAHSTTGFQSKTKAELAALFAANLPVGTKVSAFMYGFDTLDGGHKVHRNGGGDDGAIVVVGNGGTPKYLLTHFSQQVF